MGFPGASFLDFGQNIQLNKTFQPGGVIRSLGDPRTQIIPLPTKRKTICDYCKTETTGDKCQNCGAPK